ncbi:MAG TPA: TonB-dependent receptor [Rhizomicrobium sp.]|nr:TonB-dependent receptor [Rhizomicrobium sp.]
MRSSKSIAIAFVTLAATSAAYAADDPQSGVLTYQPAFFAEQRPNTAYDMIARLPGFTFINTGSARGFAGTAGNVLIDGQRPTSKSDDLASILQRIPASDVERIELIRGGAPGIDMQGQTVIANVIRKKDASTQWVLDVSDNFFQDGHTVPGASLNFTEHTGASTFEASATRYNSFDDSVGWGTHTRTFYNPDGTVASSYQQRAHTTGQGSGGALTGAATIPLWDGTFKANLALQDSPFHSSANYYGDPGNRYVTDDNVGRNAELGLHWNGNIGSWEDESLVLQRLGFSKDVNALTQLFDDPNVPTDVEVFRSSSSTGESIARETLRHPWGNDVTIETGIEGAYNYLDGITSFILDGVSIPLPDAKAHVDEQRGEVFGQATWKIGPEWLLEGGSRFEYSKISERSDTDQSRSFFYPKPRAVLTWSPTKNDQVRLRYEKVVGQLDFGNFIATGNLGGNGVTSGNSQLRPDQRSQYEISYEHHFWDKGSITLQLIHEEITDVVDLVPVKASDGTLFDAPGNIGNGQNNQFNFDFVLPLDHLGLPNGRFHAITNFQLSSVVDPVTRTNRVISGERPQDIEFSLLQDIESLKSTWKIGYFNGWDERYYRLEQTQHRRVLPPYLYVYWEYKPTPDWSLHFELDNLGQFVYENEYFNFAGERNSSPLLFTDDRSIKSQPRIYIEVRKTFG